MQEAVGTLQGLLTDEIDCQRRSMAARAAPLEAQVRADYVALCARLESVRDAYDALATGLDDSVRRHAERHIDTATFERMQRASEEGLRERAAELAGLDELRARFLAALDDEPATALGTPRPLGQLLALGSRLQSSLHQAGRGRACRGAGGRAGPAGGAGDPPFPAGSRGCRRGPRGRDACRGG